MTENTDKRNSYSYSELYRIENTGNIGELKPSFRMHNHPDYAHTKKIPLSSTPHPVSEIAYSRSDYDGSRWWTTWFDCQEQKPEWEVTQEIDGFYNALFDLPEMTNLDTVRKFCTFAEPTNCPTEFNFYVETSRLYIWIRLITRNKDYNVYIHYYRK